MKKKIYSSNSSTHCIASHRHTNYALVHARLQCDMLHMQIFHLLHNFFTSIQQFNLLTDLISWWMNFFSAKCILWIYIIFFHLQLWCSDAKHNWNEFFGQEKRAFWKILHTKMMVFIEVLIITYQHINTRILATEHYGMLYHRCAWG